MENVEIYFRNLAPIIERENFLEKEMLDADVRFLETRASYFDKLSILAGGSLAASVSFLGLSVDHPAFHQLAIRYKPAVIAALVFLLISLLLSLAHNYLISRAVDLLSKQIEKTYHSAHAYRFFRQENYDPQARLDAETRRRVARFESHAKEFQILKNRVLKEARTIGFFAVLALVLGYGMGIIFVLSIVQ